MKDKKGDAGGDKGGAEKPRSFMELDGKELNFRYIMKEVELLGSSDMTWKERKDLQNKKVVSLGGKAPNQQRLPLSVARLVMKNQKKREEKRLQQELLCGHSGSQLGRSAKQNVENRGPEDSILRSSEGRFRNSVLDVKHLLRPAAPPRDDDRGPSTASKGKKKKDGEKNHSKRKGGGRNHH